MRKLWKRLRGERGYMELTFAATAIAAYLFLMLLLYNLMPMMEARADMAHVLLNTADSLSLDIYRNNLMNNTTNLFTEVAHAGFALVEIVDGDTTAFAQNGYNWNTIDLNLSNDPNETTRTWQGRIYGSDAAAERRYAQEQAIYNKAVATKQKNLPPQPYVIRTPLGQKTYGVNEHLLDAVEKKFNAYLNGADFGFHDAGSSWSALMRDDVFDVLANPAAKFARIENEAKKLENYRITDLDLSGSYVDAVKQTITIVARYKIKGLFKFKLPKLPGIDEIEILTDMPVEQSCMSKLWVP